jgi:hypothetical protein
LEQKSLNSFHKTGFVCVIDITGWMLWGWILRRGKRFFSLLKHPDWVWGLHSHPLVQRAPVLQQLGYEVYR